MLPALQATGRFSSATVERLIQGNYSDFLQPDGITAAKTSSGYIGAGCPGLGTADSTPQHMKDQQITLSMIARTTGDLTLTVIPGIA